MWARIKHGLIFLLDTIALFLFALGGWALCLIVWWPLNIMLIIFLTIGRGLGIVVKVRSA